MTVITKHSSDQNTGCPPIRSPLLFPCSVVFLNSSN